jgi:Histidine kinase-like ATPase domain
MLVMSMCWQTRRRYSCNEQAPQQARRDSGHAAADAIGEVELVVSELMTNSVKARCGDTLMELDLHHDHIRLSIHDDAWGEPEVQHPDHHDPHGRGLRIVDQIARSWGVLPAEGGGKEVWAVLSVSTDLTQGMECTVSTVL